ncbi:MAG TPA: MFS transporter [Chitinophagaceae bacterium]
MIDAMSKQNEMAKAEKINLFSFRQPHMRAFHITWFTFFICFFGWFGIAPLMPVIRDELHLTKGQVGNIVIASVGITVFGRLLAGWLCDKIGPRITYCIILIAGAIPVILIGLSHNYEAFLFFRLAIGLLGASFVVTQYHTAVMFAPNVVGTANATTAGWGNMGGGVTQMVMPLIFAGFVGLGYTSAQAWRWSMVLPGIALLIMAAVYYFFTVDRPEGNLRDRYKKNPSLKLKTVRGKTGFREVCTDYRVWILFLAYGACFGIELTIDNIAALYFMDNFKVGIETAGLIAGSFGALNIFARSLGGIAGDKAGNKFGLSGRAGVLTACLLLEGLGMMIFSRITLLPLAITCLLFFALFVHMSNGATYSVVPFINKNAVGSVSGIVGAGGNLGAVIAGFAFKAKGVSYREALFIIGIGVAAVAVITSLLVLSGSRIVKGLETTVAAT